MNPSLADAYAHCQRLARHHYENFPVASRLLPPDMRPHIAAIYAFARTADDLADEPGLEAGERLRRLDDWSARLHRLGTGATPSAAGDDRIFLALAHTIAACRIPVALLDDLLSAFRQDVTTTRYERWTDVLDYCRRSANPVGRLVLRIGGYDGAALTAASDALCTALQLTNFWQDLEKDWRIGRIYVPREDRARAGADEAALAAGRLNTEWRRVLAEMTARTREFFAAGRAVCDGVQGRLRWELRLTWLGGLRVLDKIERSGYDVFARRPALGVTDAVPLLARALTWSTG